MSLHALILTPDMTDRQLVDMLLAAEEIVARENRGTFITVPGYDDDPRELWDIPEVNGLFKRLYVFGAMGVLDANVPMPNKKQPAVNLIGAFQLWVFVKRREHLKPFAMTRKIIDEFFADMSQANKILASVLASVT